MNFAHVKNHCGFSQWPTIIGQWDVIKADIGIMNSSLDEWHQLKHPGSVFFCLVLDFPSVNLISFTQYTNCSNLFFPGPHVFAMKTKLWWNSKVEIKVCILTFITSRHMSHVWATPALQLEILHRLKDSLEQGVDYTFHMYIYWHWW